MRLRFEEPQSFNKPQMTQISQMGITRIVQQVSPTGSERPGDGPDATARSANGL